MKKWLAFACTAALLTALFVIPAAAYTDADRDGVCDFAGTNCLFTDTDGDGLCDRSSLEMGRGGCGRGNRGGGMGNGWRGGRGQ